MRLYVRVITADNKPARGYVHQAQRQHLAPRPRGERLDRLREASNAAATFCGATFDFERFAADSVAPDAQRRPGLITLEGGAQTARTG